MAITVRTKYIIIAILAVLIVCFGGGYVIGRRIADNANKPVINGLTGELNHYIVEVNKQKVYITETEQEISTLRQAISNGEIERQELRKLNIKQVNELTRLHIVIDTMMANVFHTGQVVVIHDTITSDKNALILPFTFGKTDQWLNLKGTFSNIGSLDVDIKVTPNIDIWSVIKKGQKTPEVMVTTDCPYVTIIGIRSVKLDTPKPKKYGIGVNAGYGITSAFKPSPYLGIGLQYSIIRF